MGSWGESHTCLGAPETAAAKAHKSENGVNYPFLVSRGYRAA